MGARQVSPDFRILVLESEVCLGGAETHRGVLSYGGFYTCDGSERKPLVECGMRYASNFSTRALSLRSRRSIEVFSWYVIILKYRNLMCSADGGS